MNLIDRKKILHFISDKFRTVSNINDYENFPGFENINYHNPWFTEEFVRYCFKYWINALTPKNVENWLSNYPQLNDRLSKKCLLLIPAGNIPLVGLHDILCAIIAGVRLKIKLSSKDKLLSKWIINEIRHEFELMNRIQICEEIIEDFDAVIATGSDNTNRYFEYYFGKYPNILRKNRNSLAILSGDETSEELEMLTDDIFIYFGMGCRSVSKLFVPVDYDFTKLFEAFRKYEHLMYHNKYANNYDYRTAICQLNKTDYYNAGNALLIENPSLLSPLAVLHFSFFKNTMEIEDFTQENKHKIQCIISNLSNFAGRISFGSAQNPLLNEYADGIDTIKFLIKLQEGK